MDIIKELMVFNHIKYYDEPHIYYINGEKTISCTGLIHKFTTDFEAGINKPDKWAEKQGHFYTPTSMADKYAHKQITTQWMVIRMIDQIMINQNP